MEEMNSNQSNFSIVIPCYNELANLDSLIEKLEESIPKNIEILLVENGSTDDSKKYLEEKMFRHPMIKCIFIEKNNGYGDGIYKGILEACGTWICWTHADLQIPIEAVLHFINVASSENMSVKGIRSGRSLVDKFFTLGMAAYCSLLFKIKLNDINGQPTVYRRLSLLSYGVPPQDFSLDMFYLVRSLKENVQIARVDVSFSEREGGQSSWNTGFRSRLNMTSKTIKYARKLRKQL
jgi:glycosyltransferase involved in cell wall biosynthesis